MLQEISSLDNMPFSNNYVLIPPPTPIYMRAAAANTLII
jgi:hypothetical protein